MTALVGSRIDRRDGSQVLGTIVCTAKDSTWHCSQSVLYEIVWDDQTCARKVTMSLIIANGWKVLPQKVDQAECDRIWYDFQIERTRQMTARYSGMNPVPAAPIVVDRQVRMGGASQGSGPAAIGEAKAQVAAVPMDRPASAQARLMLEEAIAGVRFAVTVDHKKLSVAWLDGPVEAVVARVLKPIVDAGKVDRLQTRRVPQEATVQAAIDYVVERVWGNRFTPSAQADRMRLSASDFLGGSTASVMTPQECSVGSVPYSRLIRCVLDRWDGWRSMFVETDRTRYQLAEQGLLFPQGDDHAAGIFLQLLAKGMQTREIANDLFSEMAHSEKAIASERPRA